MDPPSHRRWFMDYVKLVGVVFLAVYLILSGLGVVVDVGGYHLVNFFAVVAGVLMLISLKHCAHCHTEEK
jgi:hypothetical protein